MTSRGGVIKGRRNSQNVLSSSRNFVSQELLAVSLLLLPLVTKTEVWGAYSLVKLGWDWGWVRVVRAKKGKIAESFCKSESSLASWRTSFSLSKLSFSSLDDGKGETLRRAG